MGTAEQDRAAPTDSNACYPFETSSGAQATEQAITQSPKLLPSISK